MNTVWQKRGVRPFFVGDEWLAQAGRWCLKCGFLRESADWILSADWRAGGQVVCLLPGATLKFRPVRGHSQVGFFSSIFGRKGKNKGKGEGTQVSDPSNGLTPREIARRTAEKIDEIEMQMVGGGEDAASSSSQGTNGAAGAAGTRASANEAAQPAGNEAAVRMPPMRPREGAIQIQSSGLLPLLEEVSILFANGQVNEATLMLRNAIYQEQLGEHTRLGWKMLLELYQAAGLRAEFENLAVEYASSFELSPPAWSDELVPGAAEDNQTTLSSTVLFPAVIDAQIVKQIEQMNRAVQRKRNVRVDFSRVTSVDMLGADLLLRVFRDFRKARNELTVCGVEALDKALIPMTESGRRDPDEHGWQLRLLALRLLGRQQEFEDLAIEYCVTYEVSPPSWEPLPDSITVMTAESQAAGESTATQQPYVGETFVLSGAITGRAESMFSRMRDWAKPRNQVIFDCHHLVRIDFACASELLNEVVALRTAGKDVIIDSPSYLVAYLMIVMGLGDMADLRLRHA